MSKPEEGNLGFKEEICGSLCNRANIFWRHLPDLNVQCDVNPPKVVRATTRFHRNDARRRRSISLSRRIVRTITAPLSSRPTAAATVLGRGGPSHNHQRDPAGSFRNARLVTAIVAGLRRTLADSERHSHAAAARSAKRQHAHRLECIRTADGGAVKGLSIQNAHRSLTEE